MEENKKSRIDTVRLVALTSAELFDAWRIVPRLLVAGYGWLCWLIVDWYMNLQPYMLGGCEVEMLGELCMVAQPTTQHAALVTAIVGAAAIVFGLYANTGRSWSDKKFVKWDDTNMQKTGNPRNPHYRHSRPSRRYERPDMDDCVEGQDADDFWESVESDGDFPSRSEHFD